MLRLEAVNAGYGSTTVLRDVSLWVPPLSVVALLGPNGAGKTTLLRLASGLIRASAGRVTIGDEDVTRCGAYELTKRGICHVPEGRGVFPNLTVRDNIVVQATGKNIDDAVEKATTAFPVLGRRLGQLAGTMSGGEQQMLALTRAYVSSPAYILLDEVSMGLAPLIVDEIFDFLERLASEGRALLLVEQYAERALALADYVFLLNRGRVSFAGEPGELDGGTLMEQYMGAGRG